MDLHCSHLSVTQDFTCNFMENGVAILWKNYLQLFSKSTCKKQEDFLQTYGNI